MQDSNIASVGRRSAMQNNSATSGQITLLIDINSVIQLKGQNKLRLVRSNNSFAQVFFFPPENFIHSFTGEWLID